MYLEVSMGVLIFRVQLFWGGLNRCDVIHSFCQLFPILEILEVRIVCTLRPTVAVSAFPAADQLKPPPDIFIIRLFIEARVFLRRCEDRDIICGIGTHSAKLRGNHVEQVTIRSHFHAGPGVDRDQSRVDRIFLRLAGRLHILYERRARLPKGPSLDFSAFPVSVSAQPMCLNSPRCGAIYRPRI